MRVAWRVLPWVAVAVAVLLYGCEREKAGRLEGENAILIQQKRALERRAPIVRQEYIRDTVRVVKWATKYETLRDSIFRTDTLRARDTVFVRVVASADSTIRACRDVVSSCARNLALADSLRSIDQRIIRAYERARPSFVRRWSERLGWAAGGYLVGRALTK